MKKKRLIRAAALALAVSVLLLLASCGFSYEKSNLKRYVNLSHEDYYGISVSAPAVKVVRDEDVELEIERIRLEYREVVEDHLTTRRPEEWGDNVRLYYYITVEGENGWSLPPEGFSNMGDEEPGLFVIGGGILTPEFEEELKSHSASETVFKPLSEKSETVRATDVVYLDLAYRLTDGEVETTGQHLNVRIDLSSPDAPGKALAATLVGLHPGDSFDCGVSEGEPLVGDWDGDGENETLVAAGVVRCLSRNERLGRVECDVAEDFLMEGIAGKHAVMLYSIESIDVCVVPELTEEHFAEQFPDFVSSGGDLSEEIHEFLYRFLLTQSIRARQAAVEEAIWAHFEELDCIKKYPSAALRNELKELKKQVKQLYDDVTPSLIEEYGANPYETVEDFGYAYYELDGSGYSDVWEYLKKEVVYPTVKQKLIVYYIADREGWEVTDEEYDSELLQQLSYYASEEGISTDEALEKYGEEFFRQAIQYNKVMTNLVNAAVTE